MLGRVWMLFCWLLDWRTNLRKIFNLPIVDVVFVSNIRDQTDRRRFLGNWQPKEGHFNGPRYWLKRTVGRTRPIFTITEDLKSNEGRVKAREQFIAATKWASEMGARVVLLAAGTKRLFGEDGTELKSLFPGMVFTIGDNGTMLLLKGETLRALKNAGLKPGRCRIGVLGPYGFLGEMMVGALKKEGYHNIIGAGPNKAALARISEQHGIEVCQNFEEMGKVDAIVACTHSEKIRLTAQSIELIRRADKKLLVIDVAEPSNLKYGEYTKCKNVVIRQDAGNAYSPRLKYVLGAITYKMFRLSRGVTFGCFAEAMSIASALKRGEEDIKEVDWFTLNDENMELVSALFKEEKFTIPESRCFSKPIISFNLSLNAVKCLKSWKFALGRISGIF